MKKIERESPLLIEISFKKLFDAYKDRVDSENKLVKERAKEILGIAQEYPELSNGIDPQEISTYQKQIDLILEDVFSSVLQQNEIKFATSPYQASIIKSTKRFKDIVENVDDDFEMKLFDFDDHRFYVMGCCIILKQYFGYNVDFQRPFYFTVPNESGVSRSYRVVYNGDFVNIEKTENSLDITEDDIQELIDNFNEIDVWKEKFPPNSWKFSGFVLANMYDATADVSLSNFKENLLRGHKTDKVSFINEFAKIFKSLFNQPDLMGGFTLYNEEDEMFESPAMSVKSYILNGEELESSDESLCEASNYTIFKKKGYYCVSNVPKFRKQYPNNVLYKKLMEQGVGSAIIVPIVSDDKIFGILEIVSKTPQALNTINATKLEDIMPYLTDAVKREKENENNEIELLIQEECTSIHSSVHWKFRSEAQRVIRAQKRGHQAYFSEVVFENVYPLYGQIDIIGSSEARNEATKKDLIQQLEFVKKIIHKIYTLEKLPIYEQMDFRISLYLKELEEELQVNSEKQVLDFLSSEVIPLFSHLAKKNDALKNLVKEYYELIEMSSGLLYRHRRDYDESVTSINKKMASLIDKKQIEAQRMYPHYFERFKTDGVEHSLYVGESITKENSFHKIYLYNLRLWQLQIMCEMENQFYKQKKELPLPLDVASMILVFNNPLSLRFRMDEKRFDVDGTYNARYEVVKKRVDKANVKGTEERITQAGKIAIIYSQKEDEAEYLKYIEFLQSKKMLDDNVELLELEDLQGVTGLKAIRVSLLYSEKKDNQKKYYTYNDLIEHIEA